MSDSNYRSIVKTITWRLAGSTSTFLIAYLLTGSAGISTILAVIQMVVNTILYWIHERLWNRVDWGKT